jgi:flagellin
MGLRIATNIASLSAQRQMASTERESLKAISQLSSGSKFSGGHTDAADFAISEHLRGQIKGLEAAKMNAEQASSFLQVAEGGLNEQNNILTRLRELAIQSSSDTFSDTEREFLQKEYGELVEEFDRIAKSTSYGSQKLLAGDDVKDFQFQVGAYKGDENVIRFRLDANTTASGVGIESSGVSSQSDALDSLETLDTAINKIAGTRTSFAATGTRLEYARDAIETENVDLEQARSRIADTDVADAVTKLTSAQIRQSFQASVLAQANQTAAGVLKLLPV